MQKTLKSQVTTSGVGLFTGEKVSLTLCPAPVNTGIVFYRTDLPEKPKIPANLSYVRAAPRCTRLAKDQSEIWMVEHLLSALLGMEIDNVRIEVSGPEVVAGDGSAAIFVSLIEQAGIEEQSEARERVFLKEPIYWSQGEIQLIALPSEELRFSYTMHYPHSKLLGSQYYSLKLTPNQYREEIASCRTFSLYEEILPFIEKGVIKGGGLENALVIQGDRVLNPDGARFPDEMVRHKVLDLMGDLALVGRPFSAHVIAIRSGHASNVAFAKRLESALKEETCFQSNKGAS